MNIRQQNILQAGQGGGFGGIVGLEFTIQAESGAVGGAQNLI
jgi:hypothetical protein